VRIAKGCDDVILVNDDNESRILFDALDVPAHQCEDAYGIDASHCALLSGLGLSWAEGRITPNGIGVNVVDV
jgi:hypothetical protein